MLLLLPLLVRPRLGGEGGGWTRLSRLGTAGILVSNRVQQLLNEGWGYAVQLLLLERAIALPTGPPLCCADVTPHTVHKVLAVVLAHSGRPPDHVGGNPGVLAIPPVGIVAVGCYDVR